ncbi:MAG TPA: MmgE/PrpD family protein [Ramlibacter sp.]|nr:MmgE/PrpD family protein [Ramlibacter sp.]
MQSENQKKPGNSVARELARMVIDVQYSDLPDRALDHAEMLLASTIASAAAGSQLQSSRIIRAVEVERGGRAESTAWFGAAEKLPMAAAARINALSSDAAASDDSDLRNIVHQGTTACATALAVGERTGASGAEVLAAVVLGYEAAGRISSAMQCGFKSKGFHGCIVATFASTAAAARLLKLPVTETTHAIALTATSIGGLSKVADTSLAREYHAGQAALVGVQAVQAAARGYTADECALEKRDGYFEVFGQDTDPGAVGRDLGKRWCILDHLGIKLIPGGHPHHAVAEAAAQAAITGDVNPDQVEAIEVSRPGFQGFANPATPTDLIGMAHSAYFFAAAGAADRDFTWAHASEEKILDPRIQGLLGKVRMVAPPTEHLERFQSGAVVTIRTRGGRSHSATVHAPKGAATFGIAWADVEAKYRTLAPFGISGAERLEESLRVIRNFRRAANASELVGLLR